jgi:hypothetical protein
MLLIHGLKFFKDLSARKKFFGFTMKCQRVVRVTFRK